MSSQPDVVFAVWGLRHDHIPNSHLANFGTKSPILHLILAVQHVVGQDRKGAGPAEDQVCSPTALNPNPTNTFHQDRRRRVLRGPPATTDHRQSQHQVPGLPLRHRPPLHRRLAPPQSRSRRLRRRPLHLPDRSLPKSRAQARRRQQSTARSITPSLSTE